MAPQKMVCNSGLQQADSERLKVIELEKTDSVNIENGMRIMFLSTMQTYEKFLDTINASRNIPKQSPVASQFQRRPLICNERLNT